jgi:hypothetical protein
MMGSDSGGHLSQDPDLDIFEGIEKSILSVRILSISFFIEKEPQSQPEISEGNIEEEKWKGG